MSLELCGRFQNVFDGLVPVRVDICGFRDKLGLVGIQIVFHNVGIEFGRLHFSLFRVFCFGLGMFGIVVVEPWELFIDTDLSGKVGVDARAVCIRNLMTKNVARLAGGTKRLPIWAQNDTHKTGYSNTGKSGFWMKVHLLLVDNRPLCLMLVGCCEY